MSVESDYKQLHDTNGKTDFVKVSQSSQFKELMKQRKRFIVPLTIFFLLFYLTLPVLTSYTTILNNPVIGDITWAWVYAFAQFVMTWILCTLYVKKSAAFDRQSNEIIKDQLKEDRGGN